MSNWLVAVLAVSIAGLPLNADTVIPSSPPTDVAPYLLPRIGRFVHCTMYDVQCWLVGTLLVVTVCTVGWYSVYIAAVPAPEDCIVCITELVGTLCSRGLKGCQNSRNSQSSTL